MSIDRFHNYDAEVRRLVLAFEGGERSGRRFFDVDELEIIADYYLEVQDVEGMEKAVRLGESLYPSNSAIRLRRAQLCGVSGAYQKALKLLSQLEQEEPDNTDVCYSLGTLYSLMGEPKKSIEWYLRAAEDGYGLNVVYDNVADEYGKLGNTAQAVRYFRKAVENSPNDEYALNGLSNIWEWQGRNEQAVRYFSQHVADHPYSKVGWYCLGKAYLALNPIDTKSAIDALGYALAIDSHFEDASFSLARAYELMGDTSRAVQAYRDVLEYTHRRAYVLRSIGDVYVCAANWHTAFSYYREAVKEDPADSVSWLMMGRCSEELGYNEEAVAHYLRAINLDPDQDANWLNLANFYIKQERFDDAVNLLESARTEASFPFWFDMLLLYCYYRLGLRNRLFRLLAENGSNYVADLKQIFDYFPDLAKDVEIVNAINDIIHE